MEQCVLKIYKCIIMLTVSKREDDDEGIRMKLESNDKENGRTTEKNIAWI